MAAPEAAMDHALDSARLTPTHWKIWLLSAMGVYLDGFDLFIIAVALPLVAADFKPDATTQGLIGAAAPLGAVIGAVAVGRLADRWGRKVMFFLDLVFFVVFSVLSGLAWDVASLIAFRFLLGVGIGADYPLSSSYVSEFMPARLRGRMMVAGFSFQALGSLSGAGVGLLVLLLHPTPDAWRFMLMAGVIPALLVVMMRSTLPESPRWCANNGRCDEASAVLTSMLGTAVAAAPEEEGDTSFAALFSRRYIRRTILSTVPWFLMDVCLYGVGFFTPTILAAMAFTRAGDLMSRDIASTEGAVVLDVFLVVGFALAIWLVERWGRIRLQLVGFAGMTVGLALLAISAGLPGDAPLHLGLIFGGFALFNLMVNMGPNPTTFLLPAELFPTSLRATGHGLAAAAGKVGATVGVFLLPVLRDAWGLCPSLAAVAVFSLLGFIVTWAFGVETRGRSLAELTTAAGPRAVPSPAAG